MKPLTILLIGIVLVGCRKQEITVDVKVGHYYSVKSNVFNKGAYQPKNPVRVDSTYIDQTYKIPYAKVWEQTDWTKFALKPGNGVADMTAQANQIMVNSIFPAQGRSVGDTVHFYGYIPQADLQ